MHLQERLTFYDLRVSLFRLRKSDEFRNIFSLNEITLGTATGDGRRSKNDVERQRVEKWTVSIKVGLASKILVI